MVMNAGKHKIYTTFFMYNLGYDLCQLYGGERGGTCMDSIGQQGQEKQCDGWSL